MEDLLTRRAFLGSTAALAASLTTIRGARAAAPAGRRLTAATRTLDVGGRAATVYGLVNEQGGHGLILDPGERFRVRLTNATGVPTGIHWHGQIPPNAQDGVPGMPLAALRPGEGRDFDFEPRTGTHWMHSHIPEQEMLLMAAPLIVRTPDDVAADRQEVVLFLHDFSFSAPEGVIAQVTGGARGTMAGMDHAAMGHAAGGMPGMAMDLNDFNFDAYLANDRTLADPEVVSAGKSGRVLLRVVNAAAATTFWIDTGMLEARLVAVDGDAVQPLAGRRFGLAMAQRLDLELELPAEGGAFPILALREGARERTGLVLATPGAAVPKIATLSDSPAPAFDTDLAQEGALRAAAPPAGDAVPPRHVLLGGAMMPYRWTIDDRAWGEHVPITARTGERVELLFRNASPMGHPMHLHGHRFQVVGIGGRRFPGAVRDTVYVPPMAQVTVALNAGEAARWMLHCHHMLHLSAGMMTEFAVSARAPFTADDAGRRNGPTLAEDRSMTSFSIPDMSCGHCKAAVEQAIASVDPSAKVEVDLAARSARVASGAATEALLKALAEAGYPAAPAP